MQREMENLGAIIHDARKSKRYSQEKLANICHISSSQISKFEKGILEVPEDIQSSLFKALGLKDQAESAGYTVLKEQAAAFGRPDADAELEKIRHFIICAIETDDWEKLENYLQIYEYLGGGKSGEDYQFYNLAVINLHYAYCSSLVWNMSLEEYLGDQDAENAASDKKKKHASISERTLSMFCRKNMCSKLTSSEYDLCGYLRQLLISSWPEYKGPESLNGTHELTRMEAAILNALAAAEAQTGSYNEPLIIISFLIASLQREMFFEDSIIRILIILENNLAVLENATGETRRAVSHSDDAIMKAQTCGGLFLMVRLYRTRYKLMLSAGRRLEAHQARYMCENLMDLITNGPKGVQRIQFFCSSPYIIFI